MSLQRSILPVNIYTEWYWKNDLHNLLHFIGLRSDSHAQYEIRVYSDAMAKFVKEVAPHAWEAYEDPIINGMRFSGPEQKIIRKKLPDRIIDDIYGYYLSINSALNKKNKSRDERSLYALYKREVDSIDDFKLKWSSEGLKQVMLESFVNLKPS